MKIECVLLKKVCANTLNTLACNWHNSYAQFNGSFTFISKVHFSLKTKFTIANMSWATIIIVTISYYNLSTKWQSVMLFLVAGNPFGRPPTCNRRRRFRTITGVCNNLGSPFRGASKIPLVRLVPENTYEDGKLSEQ